MSFLSAAPSVFVIGDQYELLLFAKKNGILFVEIGKEQFFEENAGVLATERRFAKVRVPQSVLDGAEGYTVVYRETIDHKAYFSEIGEEQRESFAFRPIKKADGICIFYLSDVHSHFSLAEQAAAKFADETDLYIMNGDVAEVEKEEDFLQVSIFLGQVAKGAVPIVFVRGNHDTRGKLSHFYTDYFPSNGKDTYFTFSVGPIDGIALDCGEDKPDDYVYGAEYGYKSAYAGINRFAPFRRRELAWLKEQAPLTRPYRIAVSHICPMQTARRAGCEFDIEREVYTAFSEQLSRLGVQAMLCGHIHRAYTMLPGDGQSLLAHTFPIVVGAFLRGRKENGDALVGGTALLLEGGKMQVRFTDGEGKETESTSLSLL